MLLSISLGRKGFGIKTVVMGASFRNTGEIEADTFNPRAASSNYITVSGGGPRPSAGRC